MAKKTKVLSVRITEDLKKMLIAIAERYNIEEAQLVSAVLTSFVDQYSALLVDEDKTGIK